MSLSETAYGTVTAVSTTDAGSLVDLRLKSSDKKLEGTEVQAFVPSSIRPPNPKETKPGDRLFLVGELDIIPGSFLPDGNDLAMLRADLCLRA